MHIKAQTDYAIRIVDYLSKEKELKSAMTIAEQTSIPLRFAKNILQILANKGIIISHKGMRGGYELAKQRIEGVTLYDVFEAIGESTTISRCQNSDVTCLHCSDKQCLYHDVFAMISTEIENRLQEVKFC